MARPPYACCRDIPFDNVTRFLDCYKRARNAAARSAQLAEFRAKNVPRPCADAHILYRMLWPPFDRRMYGLKQAALAEALVDACGLTRDDVCAARVLKWKTDATATRGDVFADVAERELLIRSCGVGDDDPRRLRLTVGILDAKLDEMHLAAGAGSVQAKAAALRWLVANTTHRQMHWVLKIILKDLKIGLSRDGCLRDYHRDAPTLYAVDADLERVLKELADPGVQAGDPTVQPGNTLAFMVAKRAFGVDHAFEKVRAGAGWLLLLRWGARRFLLFALSVCRLCVFVFSPS